MEVINILRGKGGQVIGVRLLVGRSNDQGDFGVLLRLFSVWN
ncbi:hypothetical protein [Thermincola potens]|nr:hypothetical protein [Thermincola potens]